MHKKEYSDMVCVCAPTYFLTLLIERVEKQKEKKVPIQLINSRKKAK